MLWVGSFHYSIDSYKLFLHMHCFGYPELIFPLETSLPIILFRFLETNVWWNQSYYAMNVPLTFIIFFAFPEMKTHFPPIKLISIGAKPVQKLCFVVHRKESGKLSSPLLQFTFDKKKTKSFKKAKFVYLRMSIR